MESTGGFPSPAKGPSGKAPEFRGHYITKYGKRTGENASAKNLLRPGRNLGAVLLFCHRGRKAKKNGGSKPPALGLGCCIQHIPDKNSVTSGRIVDRHMGHCTDAFAVLDNGTSGHERLSLGTTISLRNISALYPYFRFTKPSQLTSHTGFESVPDGQKQPAAWIFSEGT